MRDGINGYKTIGVLDPAATTANRTGDVVDVQGYDSATIVVQVGTVTTADATNYFTFDLYHGDLASGTDGTSVDAAERINAAFAVNDTSDAGKTVAFGYLGNKRYIHVVCTETATGSIISGAMAVLGYAAQQPAAGAELN